MTTPEKRFIQSRFRGGTTCEYHGKCVKEFAAGRFWLMKHTGHTTYVDRMTGSAYCGTAWYLYDASLVTEYYLLYANVEWHDPALLWTVRGFLT